MQYYWQYKSADFAVWAKLRYPQSQVVSKYKARDIKIAGIYKLNSSGRSNFLYYSKTQGYRLYNFSFMI